MHILHTETEPHIVQIIPLDASTVLGYVDKAYLILKIPALY